MKTPAGPLKTAIEARLRASTPVRTALGLAQVRLYTAPPTNAPLPYLVIGEDQVIPSDLGCGCVAEAYVTVHAWVRPDPLSAGAGMSRDVAAAVLAELGEPFPVSGWALDLAEVESERHLTDPDGSTHAVLQFRFLLTEASA